MIVLLIRWLPDERTGRLRKQNGRQFTPAVHRRLVSGTPRIEELDELLTRAVLVPLANALHDLQQMLGRLVALAGRVERHGKIETRLMVLGIRGDFLFKFTHRSTRLGLLGALERGTSRHNGRVVVLGFGNERERLLRLLECA